ncbi:glycoside hydrolase family 2 [Niabella aurantiaca]|uniref:glycoside hydrolase family 2 n=1 Tax=Niabella aurantiaca TaxID=379900 RepID=UPI0005946998|nr:glycoside hydrolase family 2 [Niabella aurantiaca]
MIDILKTRIAGTLLWILLSIYGNAQSSVRERIALRGSWGFRMDPQNAGMAQRWMNSLFAETVTLPGSMAQWHKGVRNTQPTTQHLNAPWSYTGKAWYQKCIHIPVSWNGRTITLNLERTKATSVWLDGVLVGKSRLLSAMQVIELGHPEPGLHTLTICVDNTPSLFAVGGSHALSAHTQTNWNGIIGNIFMESRNSFQLARVRVKPNADQRLFRFSIQLRDEQKNHKPARIKIEASAWNTPKPHRAKPQWYNLAEQTTDRMVILDYPLGPDALFWDEYRPALYRITVTLYDKNSIADRKTLNAGLRTFRPQGTQFSINNRITFLRGKNESCVFPLTGFPPTATAEWQRLYRIAKQYGINHYRFHSYTPPEAAFEAADIEGIYIQAELPNWSNFNSKDSFQNRFQYEEGRAILDAYGNHPSFVMLSLGNELAGDETVPDKMIKELRAYDDNRRLYTIGTNAFYNDPHPGPGDDFWVTMRTGKETPDGRFDVRGGFATTEDAGNGILNTMRPNTRRNYNEAIKPYHLPVVGHEIGQYQLYPDYTELPQYTGVLQPANLRIFRERLQKAGMGDQAADFFKASGMLAVQLYRREIEMALGTPGFGGFQLLDLQDFPGQGTALVGLLNAFMRSKGLITPEAFRQFCNDRTLQVLMDKYTWTNEEQFTADIRLVNYRPENLSGKIVSWNLTGPKGQVLGSGKLRIKMDASGIIPVGNIRLSLGDITTAKKLILEAELEGTAYRTSYPVWVYPAKQELTVPAGLMVSKKLDDQMLSALQAGAKVLLLPDHDRIEGKSVGGQFITEFWNWKVFKEAAEKQQRPQSAGTLGILTRPELPLFDHFPTEYYASWQWWSIIKNARPLILDALPAGYKPLVQVIDNIDRNHKLGLIFECSVGRGKLLVCMAPLDQLKDDPAARQLYYSMLQYMASDRFHPVTVLNTRQLKEIL